MALDGAGGRVPPADLFEMGVALERLDLGPRAKGDARIVAYAVDEIARHGFGEAVGAHQHVHLPCALGEENRRLARGVGSADDYHLLAGTELGLHREAA
jgi:hypothetical protein